MTWSRSINEYSIYYTGDSPRMMWSRSIKEQGKGQCPKTLAFYATITLGVFYLLREVRWEHVTLMSKERGINSTVRINISKECWGHWDLWVSITKSLGKKPSLVNLVGETQWWGKTMWHKYPTMMSRGRDHNKGEKSEEKENKKVVVDYHFWLDWQC